MTNSAFGGALAAELEQRAQQPAQVGLAPVGGGDAHAATVEIDHPAAAVAVEQQVVRVEVGVVQALAVEAGDQPPGLLPGRAVAGHQGAVGQRAHVHQPLQQDRGAVLEAVADVAGRQRARHRQATAEQFAHQPELGEAARVRGPAPEVGIAAEARGQAAAQVVAQHRRTERRIDEPGPTTPARAHRPGALAPGRRREQVGAGLPQSFAVEENGPVPALGAVRRQGFAGVKGDHPHESNNTCQRCAPHSACCACPPSAT